jgi:outer membrane protein assembly factor BamD
MSKTKLLYVLILMLGVAACSGSDDSDEAEKQPPESAENLYLKAREEFATQQYKIAVKSFEEVERQHPSSEWAVNAQVMSAFSSYQAEDYDTAISTLDRFVKLYPNHESTPYAYYLNAICYYEQITDVGRDQKVTEQAMQALREVIRRFPDSEYARDAKIKLDLTQDHLAGKEMQVGRYYLTRDEYLAAINRFRFVAENFQTTSHVPEALHRLVECYLKLGVVDEATRYASVLGYNFPNSIWYRDSYGLLNGGAKPPEDYEEEAAEEAKADEARKAQQALNAEKLKQPPSEYIRDEGTAESAPYAPVEHDLAQPPATEAAPPEPVQEPLAEPEAPPVETQPAQEEKEKDGEPSLWDRMLNSSEEEAAPQNTQETEAPAATDPEPAKEEEPAKEDQEKEGESSIWDSVLPW